MEDTAAENGGILQKNSRFNGIRDDISALEGEAHSCKDLSDHLSTISIHPRRSGQSNLRFPW